MNLFFLRAPQLLSYIEKVARSQVYMAGLCSKIQRLLEKQPRKKHNRANTFCSGSNQTE